MSETEVDWAKFFEGIDFDAYYPPPPQTQPKEKPLFLDPVSQAIEARAARDWLDAEKIIKEALARRKARLLKPNGQGVFE